VRGRHRVLIEMRAFEDDGDGTAVGWINLLVSYFFQQHAALLHPSEDF